MQAAIADDAGDNYRKDDTLAQTGSGGFTVTVYIASQACMIRMSGTLAGCENGGNSTS